MAKPKDYNTYLRYIQGTQWQDVKARYWHSIRYDKLIKQKEWAIKCTGKCGFKSRNKSDFDVHHMSYRNFGNEKIKELTHLCRQCHNKVHDKARSIGITMFKNKTMYTGSNQTHLWQITKELKKQNKRLARQK